MRFNDFFPDGVEKAATAGFFGAIAYWITNKKNPRDGVMCLIVGVISAIYLGPLIEPVLRQFTGPDSELPATLAGFVCGMSGISLNGLIVDLVHGRARMLRDAAELKGKDDEQR